MSEIQSNKEQEVKEIINNDLNKNNPLGKKELEIITMILSGEINNINNQAWISLQELLTKIGNEKKENNDGGEILDNGDYRIKNLAIVAEKAADRAKYLAVVARKSAINALEEQSLSKSATEAKKALKAAEESAVEAEKALKAAEELKAEAEKALKAAEELKAEVDVFHDIFKRVAKGAQIQLIDAIKEAKQAYIVAGIASDLAEASSKSAAQSAEEAKKSALDAKESVEKKYGKNN